jgi:hypothetical protein
MSVDALIAKINAAIINPIIALLFALAFVIFLWGVAQMIRHADSEKDRAAGQQHILWGVIGMFIMVAVKGIIAIISTTFGL